MPKKPGAQESNLYCCWLAALHSNSIVQELDCGLLVFGTAHPDHSR
jgi:hypothetical protein